MLFEFLPQALAAIGDRAGLRVGAEQVNGADLFILDLEHGHQGDLFALMLGLRLGEQADGVDALQKTLSGGA